MLFRPYRIIRRTFIALLLGGGVLSVSTQQQDAQLAEANRLHRRVIQLHRVGPDADLMPANSGSTGVAPGSLLFSQLREYPTCAGRSRPSLESPTLAALY